MENRNPNLRENNYKRSQNFSVTVSHIQIPKEHVFESIDEFCDQIVIAEEMHHNTGYHHHLYMKTYEHFRAFEIELIIRNVYSLQIEADEDDEINIHVATVKNIDYWIKYITSEDPEPLTKNVSDNKLSFYTRTIQWARRTEKYSEDDPFVLRHGNRYKLLEGAHQRVREKMNNSATLPMLAYETIPQQEELRQWQHEVINWWNDWIVNGWQPRKKQLYLWGPSTTGKTSFIHRLLSNCIREQQNPGINEINEYAYEEQVFTPTPNCVTFAWETFDERKHTLVLIDEFSINQYDVNNIKKMLAGESFMANTKCKSARRLRLRMPMIVISNLSPPDETISSMYYGVRERFKVVSTQSSI